MKRLYESDNKLLTSFEQVENGKGFYLKGYHYIEDRTNEYGKGFSAREIAERWIIDSTDIPINTYVFISDEKEAWKAKWANQYMLTFLVHSFQPMLYNRVKGVTYETDIHHTIPQLVKQKYDSVVYIPENKVVGTRQMVLFLPMLVNKVYTTIKDLDKQEKDFK